MNLRTAVYKGEPVLTWWEGKTTDGLGVGTARDPRQLLPRGRAVPLPGTTATSDLHEFLITSRNTALVTSYEMRTMDLTAFGGEAAGTVVGGIVQELEIPSARVLFEWRSLDHVPLEESHATAGDNFFDYFHVNSIDIDGDGDLLLSARNTWAVYKIGRKSGDVTLASRRQAQRLHDGRRHELRLAARRPPPSGRPAADDLRRRRRADRRAAVARAADRARSEGAPGHARPPVRAPSRPAAIALHGQRSGARQRQRRRRLGQRAVHHRVRRRRVDPLRGEAAARRPELPRLPAAVDGPARRESRSSWRTARPG